VWASRLAKYKTSHSLIKAEENIEFDNDWRKNCHEVKITNIHKNLLGCSLFLCFYCSLWCFKLCWSIIKLINNYYDELELFFLWIILISIILYFARRIFFNFLPPSKQGRPHEKHHMKYHMKKKSREKKKKRKPSSVVAHSHVAKQVDLRHVSHNKSD
jgi:hypothetical protein